MPAFLEHKLQKEYGKNSDIPYKVMNSIGAMHGNKETAKGKAMEKKHNRKEEIAKKMGHSPHHHERHIKSQMKYFGGKRFKEKAEKETEDNSWKYARENRMTDKRIF